MVIASAERIDGSFVAAEPDQLQPPSATEIIDLHKEADLYFAAFHGNCDKVDTYYYGDNAIPAPQGFAPIHTAQARSIINTATDHVDVNNLSIDVPLASLRAKARAERIKKFLQGVWLQMKPAVKEDAVKHAFSYGVGWLKIMYESDRWPNAPREEEFEDIEDYKEALADFLEARRINFPITVDVVNPKRLVWDDSRVGPRWVIESYERIDVRELKMRYPHWSGVTGIQGVTWREYWDDRYFIYFIDNEVVAEGEHGYGFFNYIAVRAATSLSHDDGPPERRYQGLLHGRFDLLDEIDRTVTAHSAILRAYAWPTIDFTGPQHLVDQAKTNYEMFGSLNGLPSGVSVEVSPRPQPPPELMQGLSVLQTLLEESTFPNVVRGVRPRGVSTGFAVSVLAGMGRLVFQPIASGMAKAAEEMNKGFLKLVENKVKGSLTVHARTEVHQFDETINPRDIRGYYENKVILKAESPEEREREALLAFRLWNGGNGLLSQYEAMRRAGVVNPLEMQVDMTAERFQQMLNQTPEMMQLVLQRVGLLQQAAQVLGVGGGADGLGIGSQALGLGTLPRPGEGAIQQQRVASREATPSVFPQGMGGLDNVGNIGVAGGGALDVPSGQTVGR
jgi:hypothetical protein